MERLRHERRATLEHLAAVHVDAAARWLRDPELRTAIDTTARPDPAGNRAYWESRLADPAERCFAILDGADHVGNCGLRVDAARRKAELWIYLGERRGRGLGTEAVAELLRLGFEELTLNRVYLRALATNEGALRFWRCFGFVEEGRWRQDAWVDGLPVDSIWFGLLRHEWKGRLGMDAV